MRTVCYFVLASCERVDLSRTEPRGDHIQNDGTSIEELIKCNGITIGVSNHL